jgi:dienelactone hydrolase
MFMSDVQRESIIIWSQGIRLAGDIYKPGRLKANEELPGILMVPGWGGSKQNLGKNYAPHFAKQGFVVLAFDFKSWGESDGPLVAHEPLPATDATTELTLKATHIRELVNPFSMSEDVRAALNYLAAESGVMGDNLGIWGTSMGGGLALVMAASDDRIKALVSQMGPLNYKYNLNHIPDQKMRQVEAMVARGELPPFPGPTGSQSSQLKGYPDWVAMKRFDPMSYLDDLNIPTLIIDAEKEALFDIRKNGLLAYETIKDRLEALYITYPGQHYDMYEGENLRTARSTALQWFVKHLWTNKAE